MTNIVYISTDDTGQFVGPYGHDIDTPALQQLAEDGIFFRDVHSAAPTCSPSRAAQMTGMAPHTVGMLGLAHRGFAFDDYDCHLAQHLGDLGFETVLVGQQHEAEPAGMDRSEAARQVIGYDRVLRGEDTAVRGLEIDHSRTRQDLANAAAVSEYLRNDPPEPFFLSFGLYNTHQPIPLEQDRLDPEYVTVPGPLPDTRNVRREITAYHLLVEYVDQCVGRVVDALRETGQLDETVLVFTSDHGAPFPQMKCNLFEGGTSIPLVARFPDAVTDNRGTVEDTLVSNTDIFPTLCEAVGVPVPERVHGSSLLPLVRNEVESVREETHSEVTYHAAYEPKRCLRTQRWTYIRRYDDDEGEPTWDRESGPVPRVAPNTDPGPAKDVVTDAGLFDRPLAREALYDRTLDPAERENLADHPDFQDVRDTLAGRLTEWMRETGDPLVEGPVSKPPGAVATVRHEFGPDGEREPPDTR